MIEASELRIGNFVEYPLIGGQQIRNGADIDSVYGDAGMAVPLTEEWLIKLGFTIDKDGCYLLQNLRKSFSISPSEDNCLVYGHDIGVTWHLIRNSIDYVHQLQNLYFALTGEELIMNIQ